MRTLVRVCLLTLISALVAVPSGFAQTNVYGGEVKGKWKLKNSPYHVLGEITIPDFHQLKIEPGVVVVFMGHFKFNVQGRLLAIGTEQDPILFTAEDTEVGWHGIRFMNTQNYNDTSKMVYCTFQYGKANTGSGLDRCGGAIMIKEFDKVLVSNCGFVSNYQSGEGWDPIPEAGPAIYIYNASPVITNSYFAGNRSASKGSAVVCVGCPNPIISNSTFTDNEGQFAPVVAAFGSSPTISCNYIYSNRAKAGAGGILIDWYSNPTVVNNIVFNNDAPGGGGIALYQYCNPVFIDNTIANNSATTEGGGIYLWGNCNPGFLNNIIYGNTVNGNTAPTGSQVFINDIESDPMFWFCDIEGGKDGFGGIGAGANYTGYYMNNIDSDPLFMRANNLDYRLSDYSPCVGAGLYYPDIPMFPIYDMFGVPRPSPSGTVPDIGAVENLLGSPLPFLLPKQGATEVRPTEYALKQNFPNPFNPTTTIQYALPERSLVTVTIFNTLGEKVAALVNGDVEAGYHEVQFNASGLASGVYLYRLQAGTYVETRKLLLLR